jgi:hypothetical protein
MTETAIHTSPARSVPLWLPAWPLLAILATLAVVSVLAEPAPQAQAPDPTPVEVWHGNSATFGPAR